LSEKNEQKVENSIQARVIEKLYAPDGHNIVVIFGGLTRIGYYPEGNFSVNEQLKNDGVNSCVIDIIGGDYLPDKFLSADPEVNDLSSIQEKILASAKKLGIQNQVFGISLKKGKSYLPADYLIHMPNGKKIESPYKKPLIVRLSEELNK